MSVYKITISPELTLLASAIPVDLEYLIQRAVEDSLAGEFIVGDEITDYDIRNWIKIEEENPNKIIDLEKQLKDLQIASLEYKQAVMSYDSFRDKHTHENLKEADTRLKAALKLKCPMTNEEYICWKHGIVRTKSEPKHDQT